MGVSETILAAMIGAVATLLTAAFQLLLTWRDSGKPERSSRSGMRSLLWTLTLMGAAAVGGFAYAEYRALGSRDETQALRNALQQQLQALSTSTARLEQLRVNGSGSAPESAAQQRLGMDGVAAVVNLPACHGTQGGFAADRADCSEQDALRVTICAPVPATSSVSAVELFARPEGSQQPWAELRAKPGQDVGGGRFGDSHDEHLDSDGTKQVCYPFSYWNSEKGSAVRILVRYVP